MKKKIASLLPLMAGAGATLAPVAHAEGSFTTNLQDVRNGYQSRRWEKRHAHDETRAELRGCRDLTGAAPNLQLELRRSLSFRPDYSHGSRNFNDCSGGISSNSWGTMRDTGTYFLQVHTFDWNNISADYMKVDY